MAPAMTLVSACSIGTKNYKYLFIYNYPKHAHAAISKSRQVADHRGSWPAEKHTHFLDTQIHNLQRYF